MHFDLTDVSVDSGVILIADKSFYQDEIPDQHYIKVVKVPNGKYRIKWEMPETYHGEISGEGIVNVTSGFLVIADPCYIIKKWNEFLDEYEFFDIAIPNVLVLDKHGGDGSFDVSLEIL